MSLEANMELGICGDGCDRDVADCYNKGYCYYEHLQDMKELQGAGKGLEHVCALCGKDMDETERGVQYCPECEHKYLKKNGD